jgi:Rod binding domain-containing protein
MIGETSSVSAAIASASVPTAVQKEGTEAVDNYKSALQFEGVLLKEMLTEALPEEMGGSGGEGSGGEGEEEGAFSYNPQLSSLPETVSNSIVAGGGLGLAKEMYKSFGGAQ